ncbi:hypothetical protein JR316_0009444 [Psilocybe cubensis]|uniref:Uncharacterized protein n=1 Tax=Psilocybe cubensis TaxID=181762 RepID=A0ACB8GTS4_PSICU|nr:hypothetical protein JR316_0009444 [Psilocybe cubensis]KAH9478981.1 hypothetical protein JR316_0009444 [Psilocybe cubensis]
MTMSTSTELPIDIINFIMVIAVGALDAQSVSSIALLSHHFRIVANKQRFSDLTFYGRPIRNKIHVFATLIEESAGYESMRGIHTFITSINLDIPNTCDADKLQPYTTIFKHLFRHDAVLCTPIRAMSLSMYNVAKLLSMDPALDISLRSLLRESHINFLELFQSFCVPCDLLQGSKLEHISLLGVSILSKYPVIEKLEPVYLKSLSVTWYSHPQFEIINLMELFGAHEAGHFSNLTSLTISTSSGDFANDLLKLSPRLETLTLNFSEGLNEGRHIPPGTSRVHLIGYSLPSHLENLSIYMRFRDHVESTLNGPDDGLLDADILLKEAVSWDEHLHSLLCGKEDHLHLVPQVTVRLVRQFEEKTYKSSIWEDCWRRRFTDAFSRCQTSVVNFFLYIDTVSIAYDSD